MRLILLLVLFTGQTIAAEPVCAGTPLTPEEASAGWKDMTAASQWSGGIDKPLPQGSWKFENGCIELAEPKHGSESIYSTEQFDNFELVVDWAVSEGGNSGLKYGGVRGRRHPDLFKYVLNPLATMGGLCALAMCIVLVGVWLKKFRTRVALWVALASAFLLADGVCYAAARWFSIYQDAKYYPTGLEYQMIDDDRHPDGKLPSHRTGSLYDMLPAVDAAPATPGQFNQSRIVVKGTHAEHWLNGRKVLTYEFGSEMLKDALAKSKFAKLKDMSEKHGGYLELQNHGDRVWFRNLRIRSL